MLSLPSNKHNCRRLLAGKATSVRQYMPYFTSPTTRLVNPQCTFVSLQITTCGYLDEAVSVGVCIGQYAPRVA